MTAVNGASSVNTAAATQSTSEEFKASDALQNGRFALDFENNEVAKSYQAFLGGMGKTSATAVSTRVENKMTDWIKSHPGADKTAFDNQLRTTLMQESMTQNMLKNSLQKMMSDIEAKMKELASDRFSD